MTAEGEQPLNILTDEERHHFADALFLSNTMGAPALEARARLDALMAHMMGRSGCDLGSREVNVWYRVTADEQGHLTYTEIDVSERFLSGGGDDAR